MGEVVNVKPKLQWRLQDVGYARNMGCSLKKGLERSHPRETTHATHKRTREVGLPESIGVQMIPSWASDARRGAVYPVFVLLSSGLAFVQLFLHSFPFLPFEMPSHWKYVSSFFLNLTETQNYDAVLRLGLWIALVLLWLWTLRLDWMFSVIWDSHKPTRLQIEYMTWAWVWMLETQKMVLFSEDVKIFGGEFYL